MSSSPPWQCGLLLTSIAPREWLIIQCRECSGLGRRPCMRRWRNSTLGLVGHSLWTWTLQLSRLRDHFATSLRLGWANLYRFRLFWKTKIQFGCRIGITMLKQFFITSQNPRLNLWTLMRSMIRGNMFKYILYPIAQALVGMIWQTEMSIFPWYIHIYYLPPQKILMWDKYICDTMCAGADIS